MFYDLEDKKVKNLGENWSASNALITENKLIPDNFLVVGSPDKIVRQVSTDEAKLITENAIHYQKKKKKYSKSVF